MQFHIYIYEIAYDYLRIYLRYLLAISDIPRVSHCALAYLFRFFVLFCFFSPFDYVKYKQRCNFNTQLLHHESIYRCTITHALYRSRNTIIL